MDWLRLSWIPGTEHMDDKDHVPCSALTMTVLKAQALLLSCSVLFGLKTALFLFSSCTLVASYHQHHSPITHVYGYCELQVMSPESKRYEYSSEWLRFKQWCDAFVWESEESPALEMGSWEKSLYLWSRQDQVEQCHAYTRCTTARSWHTLALLALGLVFYTDYMLDMLLFSALTRRQERTIRQQRHLALMQQMQRARQQQEVMEVEEEEVMEEPREDPREQGDHEERDPGQAAEEPAAREDPKDLGYEPARLEIICEIDQHKKK